MVVIYTLDNTIIRKDADAARENLIDIYGDKLGAEAYIAVKGGTIGTSYRQYGGPLVKVVSRKDAELIRMKEINIGMM